jgi:hypothetical protein
VYIYLCTPACLPVYTCVYLCTPMYTCVHACIYPVYTCVCLCNPCVYLCTPYVYLCIPVYTYVLLIPRPVYTVYDSIHERHYILAVVNQAISHLLVKYLAISHPDSCNKYYRHRIIIISTKVNFDLLKCLLHSGSRRLPRAPYNRRKSCDLPSMAT